MTVIADDFKQSFRKTHRIFICKKLITKLAHLSKLYFIFYGVFSAFLELFESEFFVRIVLPFRQKTSHKLVDFVVCVGFALFVIELTEDASLLCFLTLIVVGSNHQQIHKNTSVSHTPSSCFFRLYYQRQQYVECKLCHGTPSFFTYILTHLSLKNQLLRTFFGFFGTYFCYSYDRIKATELSPYFYLLYQTYMTATVYLLRIFFV